MTYKINGTSITLQPESGEWADRNQIGIDGNGHAIYPSLREFQMKWSFMSASEFNQLKGFFDAVGTTGSAVVSLPKYGDTTYNFYDYSGCVLREPEAGEDFEQYVSGVQLLVVKIYTG